jgi:hypothetical protein
MLNDEVFRTGSRERVLDPVWRLALWLGAVPVAFALIRWGAPALGVVYPILVAVSIVATLTAVNLVMVCLVPAFERKADTLWNAWLPILVGIAMSFAEIWLAAALRSGLIALVARLG